MRVNQTGLDLIKVSEGFEGRAYPDPGTGGDPWTIGYGHTSLAGPPPVRRGMAMTRAQAEKVLAADVDKFASGVASRIHVDLNSNQFSAIVSFAYNVGLGNLAKSAVLQAVNNRQFDKVPRRLALWNKAAGRVLPGLVKRRAAEGALFAQAEGVALMASNLVVYTPDDVADMRACKGLIEAEAGKPLGQSSTAWHAGGLGVASAASTMWSEWKGYYYEALDMLSTLGLNPETITRLLFFAVLVFVGYATFRILRERYLKSRDLGV